jgi:hypothetical protein
VRSARDELLSDVVGSTMSTDGGENVEDGNKVEEMSWHVAGRGFISGIAEESN